MAFWDSTQPLGLPKGSVRSVIGLSLIWGALALLLFSYAVPEWLVALVSSIAGFYYGTRSNGGGS